jgi:hypothetical protein
MFGIYLRWWFNGFHYWYFPNGYEISMVTESMDTQVTNMFSRISKIERATRYKVNYSYNIVLEGITEGNIHAFEGLLLAEKVEQFENLKWYEVEITRGEHVIKDTKAPGYKLDFEITRRELPLSSTVLQKSLLLYIGSTPCDLDYDEVVPINKQVNDIAEMQDRQSDYTAQFRIRKTRRMKALFELSGEVGIVTSFPYQNQSCRLIQDGIEMIASGYMILDKSDDYYYYVSVYSGNLNFFKTIEPLKLTDLLLPSTDHTWDLLTMKATHDSDLNYVYPLMEPSDDGGITQLNPGTEEINMYADFLPPFIKAKVMWDEVISSAGYLCRGKILTNDTFLKIFLPISNKAVSIFDVTRNKYSGFWNGWKNFEAVANRMYPIFPIVGTTQFGVLGAYPAPYVATYKLRFLCRTLTSYPNHVYIYKDNTDDPDDGSVQVAEMVRNTDFADPYVWDGEYTTTVPGEILSVYTSGWLGGIEFTWGIMDISVIKIAYGTPVTPRLNVPDLSQTEYIKLICNLFALIPEVDPRKREIYFWNYNDLYENIPIARDWSAYLSEREDESEFKFGDYAQNNHLKYKESDDVIKGNGDGIFQVDDTTLPFEKDVVQIPVSTCDEVSLSPGMVGVNVSRINFNTYNADDVPIENYRNLGEFPETGDITKAYHANDTGIYYIWRAELPTSTYVEVSISTIYGLRYDVNDSIDPRIVYVSTLADVSPPIKKFILRSNVTYGSGSTIEIENPKIASSLQVSFSQLVLNYAGLSRMLTKTNLRRCKFNLPVYEVAGLKHYIPIYLSQYKAYFYVNKINNYIPGKLCIIDLIKL